MHFLLIAAAVAASPAASTSPTAEPPPIAPPDSIVADGIPPVPASVAAALGPYTEFRGATFLSWRPDGRDMLIATRFGDTVQVHRVAAARGARTQLTFFPDRVSNAAYTRAPASGAPFFVFSKDTGGNEFAQSYRLDTDGGGVTLLTDGKSRNSLGVFSRRGKRLAYTSTRRTGADTDLYVVDAGDPKTDRLLAQVKGGGWAVLDWSPGDDKLLVRETISVNESFLWSFDVASGERKPLTPRPEGEKADKADKVAYQDGRLVIRRAIDLRDHGPGQRVVPPGARRPRQRPAYLPVRSHRRGTSTSWTCPTTASNWPSSPTKTASAAFTCSTRAPARSALPPSCRRARSPASAGIPTDARSR